MGVLAFAFSKTKSAINLFWNFLSPWFVSALVVKKLGLSFAYSRLCVKRLRSLFIRSKRLFLLMESFIETLKTRGGPMLQVFALYQRGCKQVETQMLMV